MKPATGGSPDFFSPQTTRARRFYLALRPPRQARLVVVCGGLEHCTPEYRIERATFPFYSLEYVAQGQGRLALGRRQHDLLPGSLFAYGPGVRQHITCHARKPLVKYFIDFAGTEAAAWLRRHRLPPGGVARLFPPDELEPLFAELVRVGERGAPGAPELCRRLLECLAVQWTDARAPLRAAESAAFATYQNCRRHIQENFRSLRTLAQIAREQRLDAAYLCRLFQRHDHQSPYRYLTRLRMNAAAAELVRPGALIKNVAADFGFANPYHFSRVFKSVLGLAPEAFRAARGTLDNPRAKP